MPKDYTWTPPVPSDNLTLPTEVGPWLEAGACATVATVEPDGRPQLSVVWAHYTERDVLFATVKGRRKYDNIVRNPFVTVLITPLDSQDHYVEIRGRAQIEDGGRQLIDFLHERHRGTRPYPWDGPNDERVVVRVVPDRVLVFHG
ncbi:PPOX class probable F420-dependent enzyme [Streptomyces sp. BK022]|uniref:TIGR03618 family F420-dependent PPOX class oxidoreductase n=1 Tax=Streptomyces sp. BK022 TaxID=2512123 RepID=UPI001029ADB2|nr:TIGR03618 family F420-dependent PPOX class oxidoreductase [Streptomyces sp. BK022]RZU45726.1 PPOX class probable F420-dependent enzyme [Streptomyces sp. BK022]